MLDQRKKLALAVAASVGLHLAVLLLWAVILWRLPAVKSDSQPSEPPDPIKLTLEPEKPDLLPVPEPTPAPTTPPPMRVLDTHNLAEAATPPPDAAFQSARNTVAASELPAQGNAPLPTQRGRAVPSFAVQTREYVVGEEEAAPAPGNTPPPPVQTSPPLPRAVAQQTPPPAPAPPSTPAPTAPLKPADIALAEPASIPTEPTVEQNPYDPSFRAPTSLTEPPRPTPVRSARGGYQPLQYQTGMNGSVSNRGAASVSSVSSPMGRYQEVVFNTIQRRWNVYIGNRNDLATAGSVTIQFFIGTDGKARGTRVVANTANAALASVALQAVLDSRLPPMPPDVLPDNAGGQLPANLTFELLDPGRF